MLVWLSAYMVLSWLAGWLASNLFIYLYFYLSSSPSDFLSTVIISPPLQLPCWKGQPWYRCFHSNTLNCLPPLIFVAKQIYTRLTILTGSKNNHKIKVVASWQSAATPWTANTPFYHFRKCRSHWQPVWGGKERGSVVKECARVKWASHYH